MAIGYESGRGLFEASQRVRGALMGEQAVAVAGGETEDKEGAGPALIARALGPMRAPRESWRWPK